MVAGGTVFVFFTDAEIPDDANERVIPVPMFPEFKEGTDVDAVGGSASVVLPMVLGFRAIIDGGEEVEAITGLGKAVVGAVPCLEGAVPTVLICACKP